VLARSDHPRRAGNGVVQRLDQISHSQHSIDDQLAQAMQICGFKMSLFGHCTSVAWIKRIEIA
jgi:hypothetical protein